MYHFTFLRTSLVSQMVNSPPAMQRKLRFDPSLGWEDPLEKEMATHFRILAWRIPRAKEPGGLQSMGSTLLQSTFALFLKSHFCTEM